MTALALGLLAATPAAWVELPFHVRALAAESTPRELAALGYPKTGWTPLDLELDAKPGARLRVAVLGDFAQAPALVSELALLPVDDGRATFDTLAALLGASIAKPLAPVRPVTCEAMAESARLELPAVGDSVLRSTPSAAWRSATCDKWNGPWLAVSVDRGKKRGSLFLRAQPQTTWAVASVTVGSPGGLPHAQAKLEDWKLLAPRPLGPVMVWQRRSLVLGARELLVTDLESGAARRVTFDKAALDVACATLQPLQCVVLLDSMDLMFVDGDKKTPVHAGFAGARAGLELSPDGEHVALASVSGEQVTVGIYRRSKKAWVQHVVPARAVLDLGKWSEAPPGFVVTVDALGDAPYAQSLLLSLEDTSRREVPRTGPSWVSALGRKLEQRGAVTWLHVPQSDGAMRSTELEWAALRGGPNAWLGERFVLSGGGNDVSVLDVTAQTQVPLLDPELHLGRVFPAGDDPSWVVVLRPEGTYRVRLALPP